MRRWRCPDCHASPGEPDWDDHRTKSFCRGCGKPAVRVYEYGCFQCREEGRIEWQAEGDPHTCPDCGGDMLRVVYAPMLNVSARKADYDAADKALVTELERQHVDTTTLKREGPKIPEHDPRQGYWADAKSILPDGGKVPGSMLPFGMPRPTTVTVARHDGSPG